MTEYIERKAVFEQFDNGEADVIETYPDGAVDFGFGRSNIRDMINAIPAADVAQVVHGRWEDNGIPDSMLCGCSVCGFTCGAYSFLYCPMCGARMDGGADDV